MKKQEQLYIKKRVGGGSASTHPSLWPLCYTHSDIIHKTKKGRGDKIENKSFHFHQETFHLL